MDDDHNSLKILMEKIELGDKYELALNKKNVFGQTTKFADDKLIWLDLSNLGIKELPEQLFDDLTSLQELKLFKNQIKYLPLEIFSKLPELTEIHLKDNKINKITRSHFKNQLKLQRLFLLGNPLPDDQAKNYTTGIEVRNFLNKLPR